MYGYKGEYNYYLDLYRQLKRIANCYHYNRKFDNVLDILDGCPFTPDAVVFGLSWFQHRYFGDVRGLHSLPIPKICFIHKPGTEQKEKADFCNVNEIDIILHSAPIDESRFNGRCVLFGYGADPDMFKDRGLRRKYDIGFSGALHGSALYPESSFSTPNLRERVQDLLKGTELKCFLNGSDSIKDRIRDYDEYAWRISESKVWLATTGPNGDVTPRYYEIWASRALLFCNPVPAAYMDIFRDGINCVYFAEDLSDFLPKLRYYLKHEGERKVITGNAYSRFITGHTWRERAKQLCCIIKNTRTTGRTSKTR